MLYFFRNICSVAECAARVNNIYHHLGKVHGMSKQEMFEFMDIVQEGRTGPVMDKDVGKNIYKCSNSDAVVKRIDHHIRKHHAQPRTRGKK